MIIKIHLHRFFLIFTTLFLISCGGGNETASTERELQGRFYDSLVSGLRYETASISGLTTAQGEFRYREGEVIRFYVGDIFLGQAQAQAIVTPVELVAGAGDENNIQVQNIVMFLQSIDEDGDETNGINITATARNAANGQSVDFELAEGVFEFDAAVQTLISNITAANGQARTIVTRTQAKETFRKNLLTLFVGRYEGSFSGDDTGSWSVYIYADGKIWGKSISNDSGSNTISGEISSGGQAVISGTVGTAVFSGKFSRSGEVSGSWVDGSHVTGSFNGRRSSPFFFGNGTTETDSPIPGIGQPDSEGGSSGAGFSGGGLVLTGENSDFGSVSDNVQ